jgi:SET domain-containing protein
MRRIIVRRSSVHGRGVFALRAIRAGERIVEYKGRVISWRQAIRQHARAGVDGHTFYFGLSDGRVIDGLRGGNSARWLNHACAANCEAVEEEGRVYVHALSDVSAGAELFLDYALELDAPVTEDVSRQYVCRCGAFDCRGTMLGGVNAG